MRICRSHYVLMILLFAHSGVSLGAATLNKIAVFYPIAPDPYRSIYQEIILGCENQNPGQILEFPLGKNFNTQNIIKQLDQTEIHKVVVLGQQGLKLAEQLPNRFEVVSGALPLSPNGVSGISLISDPALLFDYLAEVAPQVKTVYVAYSEKSQWIINLAENAAVEKGLVLQATKVKNTAEAISFYNHLFDSNKSKFDAIWLPVDKISSNDQIILPIILERAWSNEVVVFSSKPSHAKRGVLFSTYPDNFDLGQKLIAMLEQLNSDNKIPRFSALQSLQLAVNIRTAAHLGLKYSSDQQRNFKLVFPE